MTLKQKLDKNNKLERQKKKKFEEHVEEVVSYNYDNIANIAPLLLLLILHTNLLKTLWKINLLNIERHERIQAIKIRSSVEEKRVNRTRVSEKASRQGTELVLEIDIHG